MLLRVIAIRFFIYIYIRDVLLFYASLSVNLQEMDFHKRTIFSDILLSEYMAIILIYSIMAIMLHKGADAHLPLIAEVSPQDWCGF